MEKFFYKSISSNTEFEIPKIKWSIFIGNSFHIENKEQAEEKIKQIYNKYPDATHHCYAYRYWTNINFDLFWNLEINPDYTKFNDDWEPNNTAWKPILSQIQWYNLHNILIIVTRYFGWTLLWVWGLIQAYSECAKQTIENSNIKEIELLSQKEITFDYTDTAMIINILNKYDSKIIKQENEENAKIYFKINKWYINKFQQELTDISKWKYELK